jgi:hypothetical protein
VPQVFYIATFAMSLRKTSRLGWQHLLTHSNLPLRSWVPWSTRWLAVALAGRGALPGPVAACCSDGCIQGTEAGSVVYHASHLWQRMTLA